MMLIRKVPTKNKESKVNNSRELKMEKVKIEK